MAEPTPQGLSEERLREAAEEFVRQGVDIRARVHDLTLAALQSRRFDRDAKTWVARRVGAAPCGDHDLLRELREDSALRCGRVRLPLRLPLCAHAQSD